MLEQLINSLDQRGLLVMQAMLGKRSIELLEDEKKPEVEVKSKLMEPPVPKILLPQGQ